MDKIKGVDRNSSDEDELQFCSKISTKIESGMWVTFDHKTVSIEAAKILEQRLQCKIQTASNCFEKRRQL